jgi:hypothetical protein
MILLISALPQSASVDSSIKFQMNEWFLGFREGWNMP